MKELFRFSAGYLAVAIEKTGDGIRLYSIRDKENKKNLLTQACPLFRLYAENLEDGTWVTLSSHTGWKQADTFKTEEGAVIVLSGNRELPGITVTLTAVCTHNCIEWKTTVSSVNEKYTVTVCDHPMLSFDTGENVCMFFPYGCGEVYTTEKNKELHNLQRYPSYGVSMQYMAFYNKRTKRGIYYGIHDTAPAYKEFSFSKKAGEKFMSMVVGQPLTHIDRGCNSQSLCGKCVWKMFDGDWYDAAVIYREWVEKEAEFLKRDRKEPEWFTKAPHWWLVHINEDASFADDIIEATKMLGTDSPIHLYLWHNAPFDNDYPHYFPVRDVAKEGLKKLKDAGIKVMPYINGRLWDTRDKKAEDFEFTSVAKKWATKDRKGVCFTETYSSKEEDGSKVCLSIMCPSTALWQEKMAYTVGKLINDEGFDAVYMDQIAAAQPYSCCDPAHPHAPGGGDWWCRSYRGLLDRVYRAIPEDAVLTTECTADPFISHMGGYLSWLWVRNNQVPAFPVIYSKYISMFGRCYGADSDPDWTGFRIFIAQSLVYGEQLGWISPRKYKESPYRDFYTECVRTRAKLGKYFWCGTETLRPPVIETSLPRLRTEKCSQAINGISEENAVIGCIRKAEDGKKLLLLVNAAKEGGNAVIYADLPDGVYGDIIFKDGKAETYMDALSLKYAEF